MVLEINIFPQDLWVRAEAWMPHRNDMASAWASEVATKALLDVICAHILQVELGTHICIIQKRAFKTTWNGPTTRRMAAQTTTANSSSTKPVFVALRACASCWRRVNTHAANNEERPSFQIAADNCQADVSRRCVLRLPAKKKPKLYQLGQGALYQTWVTGVSLPSARDAYNSAQRLRCAWAR